jgi:Flp pilus assembly protein CpaB
MAARTNSGIPKRRTRGGSNLLFAFVGALIAVAAFAFGQRQPAATPSPVQRAFVSEFQTIELPVPDRPVPAGMLVKDIPIRMERFADHQVPEGTVRDVSNYSNKITLVPLPGGLPIVHENLGAGDELVNPVVGKIPQGMRAMALKVDATASVEGWARSGSVVDVLLVEKSRTIVVAEKVKVLSVERSTSPIDEGPDAATPSTVTILVTQEQCLAINTAAPLGRIAFALRGTRDGESWKSTEFSPAELSADGSSTRASLKIGGRATFIKDGKEQQFALIEGSWVPAENTSSGKKTIE